jgi:hypothetical protein
MPFYYNPGGGADRIDISNELGISSRQNTGGLWQRNKKVHENYYKGSVLRNIASNNVTYINIDNNTLDRKAGDTYFKVGGNDVGNNLHAKIIIFQANRHRNYITHNWASGYHTNYNGNDYHTYRYGNAAAWWVNISNVYNHVAFVVQAAGGGGGYSNTSNGNGWSGGGGGGGAMVMSGKQSIANHWRNRNFYVYVGAGGRSGTHHKYAGNDIGPESGGRSTVYYHFPAGNGYWNQYLSANGGSGAHSNHYSGAGGNYGGNGAWAGGATGGAGGNGAVGAGWVVSGGAGAGHNLAHSNGNAKSYHTLRYRYLGGYGGVNNQPGVPGGGTDNGNVDWNYHGGPVRFNAPNQNNTSGGGGAGAGGNNKGNGRPGKPGGPGADGYVAMFLYVS